MFDLKPTSYNRTTSSRSSVTSQTTDSTAADKARIFVNLPNGTRIFVPVEQNATIHDLHNATLRRALKLGFQCGLQESYLQTTSPSPVVMDGEDAVVDVLDLTEDSIFSLRLLGEGPWKGLSTQKPSNTSASGSRDGDLVFIRWITLEEALSQPRLSAIKLDPSPIPSDTSLSKLHEFAVHKVQASATPNAKLKVTLYLNDCKLAAENNPASLRGLHLNGPSTAPLDIFIDVDSSTGIINLATFNDNSTPSELWGFPTTKRGICALTTALSILSTEIGAKTLPLETCQDVLFEVSHFPPLVLALRTIYELGVESVDAAASLRMLAQAFQILCLQMTPSWVCTAQETALESARQAVAWLFTMESKIGGLVVKKGKVMGWWEEDGVPGLEVVHRVEADCVVESTSSSAAKYVSVALGESDNVTARRLGKCLGSQPSDLWELYFKYENWNQLLHHEKVTMPQPTDFDFILKATEVAGRFKMVGPPQLGELLAAQLPVITLSGEGWASLYNQEDFQCSERRFYLWNAVGKKEVMKHTNPGQILMQRLEPVIAARKKEKSWAVDSWSNLTQTADFDTPEEAVVVCMDASRSMRESMSTSWLPDGTEGDRPSRLTEVKEFFKNFALRVSALRLPTYLGLVTFAAHTQVEVKQSLTPVHLNFEKRIEGVQHLKHTAIFDGLKKAREMLINLKSQHPNVKCRIVVLTDGEDNNSTISPEAIGQELVRSDITLDSVVIDTKSTANLFKISRMTGGYAFAPKTQQELFQIFLLETVVDLRTRPDIVKTPLKGAWDKFQPKVSDMPDPYTFPPCRPHPNQNDYFIALADADKYMSRQTRPEARSTIGPAASIRSTSTRSSTSGMTDTTLSSGTGGHARVILSEIKEMIKHPHEYMDVYVSESNMGFWKIVMQGPPGSAYAAGVFLLYLDLGEEFPLKPPAARFVTPVLHPNVTKHGRICHPIFDREWSSTTRVYRVFQHIWGILMSLEARDAVDPLSTLKFWTNPAQGKKEVEQYVARFASQSRAALRFEITGGSGSDTSSIPSSRSSTSWDKVSLTSATSNAKPMTRSNLGAMMRTANDARSSSATLVPKPSQARVAAAVAISPTSNYSGYMAAQRGAPPPLMSVPGQTGVARPLVARKDIVSPSHGDEQVRKLGRRASFFNMFKKSRDEKAK